MSYRSMASPAAALNQPTRPRAALPALCLTQITSWGIVYYAFPVLNPQITMATGWSATATTAAFSAALLMSAVAGIRIGRILDARASHSHDRRFGGWNSQLGHHRQRPQPDRVHRRMATGGVRHGLHLLPARLRGIDPLVGPQPRTCADDRHSRRRPGIDRLRTPHRPVGQPLQLAAHLPAAGSRPGHSDGARPRLRTARPMAPAPPPSTTGETASTTVITRSRPFLLLATALTLSAFATYAVVITLVPLLLDRGYTAAEAAWALGLGGAGQTLGRTLYAPLARRSSPALRAAVLIGMGGVTTAAFALIPGPYGLLAALAVIAGTVRGNLTLLQATAITDRWGAHRYGRLSGLLAAPTTTASALAPFAGTALAAPLGGYPRLFSALALASAAAALIAWYTAPTPAARKP